MQSFSIDDISGYEVAAVTNNGPIRRRSPKQFIRVYVCVYSRLVQLRRPNNAQDSNDLQDLFVPA